MIRAIRALLPLMAAFLAGGLVFTASGVGAESPRECDWRFSEDYFVEHVGLGGAKSPEAALEDLPMLNHTLKVPLTAVTQVDGRERYSKIGSDADGMTGYFIYLDDVRRVQVAVSTGADGTFFIDSFTTCLGV